MKFVHAADLHIDSPLSGLDRYEGAPVERIRQATRRAFSNLVDLCVNEQVQLVVLAGDLFDGDWKDYSTGLFFVAQVQRLRLAGIPVVMVRGNHDAASQVTRQLPLPDNVFELSSAEPQTVTFEQLGICVHGQSYAQRAEHRDLAVDYPAARQGYLNIGVLHTCVTGRPGHEPYAPCKLETLYSKGYDYWALGHVHEREVLCEAPWVVFPGNLQGRHIKETGAKGATLVECGEGVIRSVEHRTLDVVRFERLQVAAQGAQSAEEVMEQVYEAVYAAWGNAGGRALVARIEVTGSTEGHRSLHQDPERWEAEIRARAIELSGVWIEQVRFHTRGRTSLEALQTRGDALGQVARSLSELRVDATLRNGWLVHFEELKNKLPIEVRQGADAVKLDDPDALLDVLDDVEELLLNDLYEERSDE